MRRRLVHGDKLDAHNAPRMPAILSPFLMTGTVWSNTALTAISEQAASVSNPGSAWCKARSSQKSAITGDSAAVHLHFQLNADGEEIAF